MANRAVIAALLSIIISGLGQIYLGRVKRGIAILIGGFTFGFILTYLVGWYGVLPVLAFWVWQVIDAYKIGKKSEPQPKTSSEFKQGWDNK